MLQTMLRNALQLLFRPSPLKAGLLAIVASCLLWKSFEYEKPAFFSAIDARIVDTMFLIRGPQQTTGSVVIVDIDEASLQEHGQWPWPRDIVADLTRRIYDAGALVVGFDILFAEEDRTSPAVLLDRYRDLLGDCRESLQKALRSSSGYDHDKLLGEAVASGTGVLGYMFLLRDDSLKTAGATPFPTPNITIDSEEANFPDLKLYPAYRSIINIPEVSTASSEGFINVFPDQSGTVRKVPLFMTMDDLPYPSLAFEMVRLGRQEEDVQLHISSIGEGNRRTLLGVSMGGMFTRTDDLGQLTINFRGPYTTFPYLSAADLLKGIGAELLRGRYVLIGSSASGLMDMVSTPFSPSPGVEVHANIIDNLLKNDVMVWENYTEIGLTYCIIVVAGLLLVFALVYLGPFLGFTAGLAIMLAIVAGNYHFLFQKQQLLGISYILASLLAVFMTVSMFNYLFEGRRRLFIRRAFSHYVSPTVVNELLKNPDRLNLSVESREVTILFCDIRNFTTLSETTPVAELGQFLNTYFSLLTDIITRHGGMVDKYIGDAIMAVWGTPLDDPDHAANAVRAALEMLKAIEERRDQLQLAGQTIEVGIGINTGMVSAGNFGSSKRFDYTVLGDNVNLASRIEGLTKYYRVKLLTSEFTRKKLGPDSRCRFIDTVMVKGRNKPVDLFEPLGGKREGGTWTAETESYERALLLFKSRRFVEARDLFARLQADQPEKIYQIYLERCGFFAENPPPPEWQGVHDHN